MKPKLRSRRVPPLQILYQMDLGTDEDEAYQHVMDHFGTPPLDSGYLRRLWMGSAASERRSPSGSSRRTRSGDRIDRTSSNETCCS